MDDLIYDSEEGEEIAKVVTHHEEKKKIPEKITSDIAAACDIGYQPEIENSRDLSPAYNINTVSESENNSRDQINISSRVSHRVKNNLQILIGENGGGIWASKLPELYR